MPARPTGADSLEAAVRSSRGRLLALSAVRWACAGAAVALAGPVLLLALGTDRFPVGLLWLFVLGGAAWAGWRWYQTRPEPYVVAQALDQRWDAKDQVATAWFYSNSGAATPPAAQQQRELALQAASGRDVAVAFPYSWPQAASYAAGLLVLTVLLFGARVAMQPQLSFEPPLQQVLFPSLGDEDQQQARLEEQPPPAEKTVGEEVQSLSKRGEQAERRESPEQPPQDGTPPVAGDAPEQQGDAFEMPEVEGLTIESETGDELAFESQDPAAEASQEGDEMSGESGEPGESGTETAENQKDPAGEWNEQSNDLLDRLKEAFQDMMENLGMEPPQSAGNQQQQGGEGQQESAEQSSEAGEQASAEAGAEGSQAEMEGGEQGEGEPEQTAQGQATQSNSEEEGAQPGQSAGASGSAEGSKELAEKLAEQQAALDALEEFYMQRSEEMEGEIMVETTTAEQTAQTPYQATRQAHDDRGGAVSRDEVPLAYQSYIETYFRNLRQNNQN